MTHQKLRQLPLHAAISHLAPLSIVKLLFNLYPSAIRLPDSDGNLPLHLAFATNSKNVSAFLLQEYPDASTQANTTGDLPMEYHPCRGRRVATMIEFEAKLKAAELKAKAALAQLERERTENERRINAAEMELHSIVQGLERIHSDGQQRLRQLNEQRYASF